MFRRRSPDRTDSSPPGRWPRATDTATRRRAWSRASRVSYARKTLKDRSTRHQVTDRVIVMRVRTGLDVLEYEIRQEQAATIGRLARELRDALDALDTFNSAKAGADSRDPQRARLVDAAAYALWNFVVQRECSGFRG